MGKKRSDVEKQSQAAPAVEFIPSSGFCDWLDNYAVSIAMTNARRHLLLLIGQQDKELKVFSRTVGRATALYARGDNLYLAAGSNITKYVDMASGREAKRRIDAFYAPRQFWVTGDIDAHDLCVLQNVNQPCFVNTLFSCVARVDEVYNFVPLWQPDFVTGLKAEDRCHLTGAVFDEQTGDLLYVSVTAKTNRYEEWRLHREEGGCVIDVRNNKVVGDGLSMPSSPRLYDGSLYVLESGSGQFGRIDLKTQEFNPVCFISGFVKTMEFVDRYAVITSSRTAEYDTLAGLPLAATLQSQNRDAQCGIYIVDIDAGKIVESLTIKGAIEQIDGMAVLTGRKNPALLSQDAETLSKAFYLPAVEAGGDTVVRYSRRALTDIKKDFLYKEKEKYSILNVTGNVSDALRKDILAFWLDVKMAPRHVDPYHRAGQACLVAINQEDKIIAVTTVQKDRLSSVLQEQDYAAIPDYNDEYYFFSIMSDPDYRDLYLATSLIQETFPLLQAYHHAQAADMAKGMISVVQNEKLDHPLLQKKFKRHGYDVLPVKSYKQQTIMRKKFDTLS